MLSTMRDLVVATVLLTLAGAGAAKAAADEPDVREAPALLGEALRRGTLDADAAAAITRWILYEQDDTVAAGLIEVLRSADPTTRGAGGDRWDATARAMAALFESALGHAAARRPRDAAQWPELVALVDAAAPVIADALRETDPAQIDTLMRVLDAVAPRTAPILLPLVQALRHQRPEVRRGAATLLGAMGHAGRRAAADLQRALDDDDAGVRAAAADALRRIEAAPSPDRPPN